MVKDKVSLDSSTESADIENKPVVGSGGIFAETTTKSSDDNESFFPKLSYKERLIGFAMCFGIGILLSVLSMLSMRRSLVKTAVLQSVANVISLISSGFLVGFAKQLRNMKDKTRLVSTLVFLGSVVMTFIAALVLQAKVLVLLCILVQYLAYFWYSLSYIPFGRTIVKKCFGKCIKS